MTPDYDAIVVGGRVAGASTAMLLARCGHRVLLIERASMPSDTVSTHVVMRTGILQLTRWGIADRLVDLGTPAIRAMTLGFGDDRVHFDVRGDNGVEAFYSPRRYLVDQMLIGAAIEAGTEFSPRTRMTGLLTSDGGVTGVEVVRHGRRLRLSARFVVGADGASSRVARIVDAPVIRRHDPLNAVHYAYYSGIAYSWGWFQFTTGINAGVIPTNEGHRLVFVGRPTALAGDFEADPETEFRRLIRGAGADLAELVESGTRVSRFRGTRGLAGLVRQPYGSGWVLVGDAGYVKDPISAHGMSQAMRDAEFAARAIDRALCEPDEEAVALEAYQRVRDELSFPIFAESQALARYRWSPAEASQRMRVISEATRVECETVNDLPEWRGSRAMAPV